MEERAEAAAQRMLLEEDAELRKAIAGQCCGARYRDVGRPLALTIILHW